MNAVCLHSVLVLYLRTFFCDSAHTTDAMHTSALWFLLVLPPLVTSSPIWRPPKKRPKADFFRSVIEPIVPWEFECKVQEPTVSNAWPRSRGPSSAFHQSSTQPTEEMLPMRIQYVLAESTSRENDFLLKWAFLFVNELLTESLKTDPLSLDAVRYARGPCVLPTNCGMVRVPVEYLAVCSTAEPEKRVTHDPSEYLKFLASENVSVIIYVRVSDPRYREVHCHPKEERHSVQALSSYCMWYVENGRSIHGKIVLCIQPTELEHEHMVEVILHETIHVLTRNTFLGYKTSKYLSSNGAIAPADYESRKAALENQTWRKLTHQWTLKTKQTKRVDAELVMTPTVMEVVKDYFRCYRNDKYRLLGAEVGQKKYPDGVIRSDEAHWSKRLFPEEVASTDSNGPHAVLSKLTLAVLKDIGWYEVNMSMAQPLDFDASRVLDSGEYCHLATWSCDSVLDYVKRQWYVNQSQLVWAGPYCDRSGQVSTRACSPDGRMRYQCWFGRSSEITAGCSVYVKNSTMDTYGSNCTNIPRSWEDVVARHEQGAYAFYSMCLTFTQYQNRRGGSYLYNYPACYEFNCSRATRSFDFYVFGHGIPTCNVSRMCGPNSLSVVEWKASGGQCFPPGWGNLVCPSYADVCEKPGGLGTWNLVNESAAKKSTNGEDSSGCVQWSSSKIITGIIALLAFHIE